MSGRKAKIIDQELLKVYFIGFFRADYYSMHIVLINMQQRTEAGEITLGY